MDSISETGTITLQGDRMVITLMYHYGDDSLLNANAMRQINKKD
jgi:hypothetical protein